MSPPEVRVLKVRPRADIIVGADVHPEPIKWRWPGWLAAGKLHIMAGAPGTGKTTLALAFAAAITTGGRWPDGTRAPLGDVLVCSYEDDPADTLVPRLIAMGADLSRIHFLRGMYENGELMAFSAARDRTELSDAVKRIGNIALAIVDPIVSAMGQVDSHKNLETRQALQPLADFAVESQATVLGITHLSKGSSGRDPLERLLGSVAFGALARVVIGAAKVDDDGTDNRVMARIKSNIGPDHGGFHYDLVPTTAKGIETVSVLWGDALDGSARELLASDDDVDSDNRDAMTEAKDFLLSVLDRGTTGAKQIYRDAADAGISVRTLKRAKAKLGIRATKTRFDGGWEWSLPDTKGAKHSEPATTNQRLNREECQGVHPERVAPLAPFACPQCTGTGCSWCGDTGRNPEVV